jgi:hypothetical protein
MENKNLHNSMCDQLVRSLHYVKSLQGIIEFDARFDAKIGHEEVGITRVNLASKLW